ncbi:MAG: SipW-dependent-type signal peptide-containing protein [Clostridia bacterium]|nr:SipW-dependent-type signal peptide-containing protein [Clostridia bacterium]
MEKKMQFKKGENAMNKRKIFLVALSVCVIAILSLSTLAWFTDEDQVTNKFYVAGSEDQNPDDVFSIDVWEDDDRDDTNETVADKIQNGIEFKDILPGDDLYKEVNVENTGAYDQYVRAIVTLSDAHLWQELYGEIYVSLDKIADDLSADFTPWSIVYDAEADILTYVVYYNDILKPDAVVNLFTNVHIPENLTREQAAKMQNFTVKVVAEAVQTENVGANAPAAFATVGKEIAKGNSTINVKAEGVADILNIMANNEAAEVALDLADVTVDRAVINKGTLAIENGTIDVEAAGLENSGTATLNNVKMEAGTAGDYSNITLGEDASTTYNDVEVVSNGGGIGAANGAEVVFNSGSVYVDTASTSGRYIFYAEGEGTIITINGGEFSWDSADNQKRAYVYAGAGTTVKITGGTFGKASTRSGYTDGILGDGTIIITGGTFGFNPGKWVADGYIATENAGVWTVIAQ